MLNRYLGVVALAAGSSVLLLAGCGSTTSSQADDSAASPPATQDMAGGEVAAAKSMLDGAQAPRPGLFQQNLLKKPSLTFADYESAMQAMAQCVENRSPGTTVTFNPSPSMPGMLDSTILYVAGDAVDSSGQAGSSGPSDAATTTTANSSQSPAPDSTAGMPPSVIEQDRVQGECDLTYAAYVSDKYYQELTLNPGEQQEQKPQFMQCMIAAGVVFPKDTSNANLAQWFKTPAWFAGLTTQQNKQANACLQQYAKLVNSFGRSS